MDTKYNRFVGLSLIVVMFIFAIYFYPLMPLKMVVHFSLKGLPNGYMGRFSGVFLIPIISLFLYIVFLLIPLIDPLRDNIKEFRSDYDMFVSIFIFFLFVIELIIILYNVGIHVNVLRFLTFPLGLLYISVGFVLKKAKRNWFVGVRTPWTLSNDTVWKKTNTFMGWFFIVDGVFVLSVFFTGKFIMFFVAWAVLVFSVFSLFYSYILYNKEVKSGEMR